MRISLHLFFCSIFLSSGLIAQSVVTNNQLLWQISGNGLKKASYLYGSYHSNDPRVFKLSDSTYSAFLNAEAVVLEADIYQLFSEYDMRLKTATIKFDSKGKPFTSDTKATQTKYGSEDGRPQFLDLYFQQMAYNMGKAFFPLETVEEQLDAFEAVYERTATQKNLQDLKIVQDNLFNAYLQGDIERVRTIIQSQLNDSKNAYDRLIVKRNVNMVNGIDTLCRKKSLFVAVGCGHLAGNEGIITLLRKKGYHVRQVFASYSDKKTANELKIMSFNKFTYSDKKEKFTATFGGKPILDTNVNYFRLIYQEMGQGNTFVIEIENSQDDNLKEYAADVIDLPEKSTVTEVKHQGEIQAFEGIGYEYAAGLSWKRVFIVDGKLIKLICYGGNKFMNSNRPQSFFNQVVF
ncbi:MAG: TraB/GumN family protein [Bacteroidota bacterium]